MATKKVLKDSFQPVDACVISSRLAVFRSPWMLKTDFGKMHGNNIETLSKVINHDLVEEAGLLYQVWDFVGFSNPLGESSSAQINSFKGDLTTRFGEHFNHQILLHLYQNGLPPPLIWLSDVCSTISYWLQLDSNRHIALIHMSESCPTIHLILACVLIVLGDATSPEQAVALLQNANNQLGAHRDPLQLRQSSFSDWSPSFRDTLKNFCSVFQSKYVKDFGVIPPASTSDPLPPESSAILRNTPFILGSVLVEHFPLLGNAPPPSAGPAVAAEARALLDEGRKGPHKGVLDDLCVEVYCGVHDRLTALAGEAVPSIHMSGVHPDVGDNPAGEGRKEQTGTGWASKFAGGGLGLTSSNHMTASTKSYFSFAADWVDFWARCPGSKLNRQRRQLNYQQQQSNKKNKNKSNENEDEDNPSLFEDHINNSCLQSLQHGNLSPFLPTSDPDMTDKTDCKTPTASAPSPAPPPLLQPPSPLSPSHVAPLLMRLPASLRPPLLSFASRGCPPFCGWLPLAGPGLSTLEARFDSQSAERVTFVTSFAKSRLIAGQTVRRRPSVSNSEEGSSVASACGRVSQSSSTASIVLVDDNSTAASHSRNPNHLNSNSTNNSRALIVAGDILVVIRDRSTNGLILSRVFHSGTIASKPFCLPPPPSSLSTQEGGTIRDNNATAGGFYDWVLHASDFDKPPLFLNHGLLSSLKVSIRFHIPPAEFFTDSSPSLALANLTSPLAPLPRPLPPPPVEFVRVALGDTTANRPANPIGGWVSRLFARSPTEATPTSPPVASFPVRLAQLSSKVMRTETGGLSVVMDPAIMSDESSASQHKDFHTIGRGGQLGQVHAASTGGDRHGIMRARCRVECGSTIMELQKRQLDIPLNVRVRAPRERKSLPDFLRRHQTSSVLNSECLLELIEGGVPVEEAILLTKITGGDIDAAQKLVFTYFPQLGELFSNQHVTGSNKNVNKLFEGQLAVNQQHLNSDANNFSQKEKKQPDLIVLSKFPGAISNMATTMASQHHAASIPTLLSGFNTSNPITSGTPKADQIVKISAIKSRNPLSSFSSTTNMNPLNPMTNNDATTSLNAHGTSNKDESNPMSLLSSNIPSVQSPSTTTVIVEDSYRRAAQLTNAEESGQGEIDERISEATPFRPPSVLHNPPPAHLVRSSSGSDLNPLPVSTFHARPSTPSRLSSQLNARSLSTQAAQHQGGAHSLASSSSIGEMSQSSKNVAVVVVDSQQQQQQYFLGGGKTGPVKPSRSIFPVSSQSFPLNNNSTRLFAHNNSLTQNMISSTSSMNNNDSTAVEHTKGTPYYDHSHNSAVSPLHTVNIATSSSASINHQHQSSILSYFDDKNVPPSIIRHDFHIGSQIGDSADNNEIRAQRLNKASEFQINKGNAKEDEEEDQIDGFALPPSSPPLLRPSTAIHRHSGNTRRPLSSSREDPIVEKKQQPNGGRLHQEFLLHNNNNNINDDHNNDHRNGLHRQHSSQSLLQHHNQHRSSLTAFGVVDDHSSSVVRAYDNHHHNAAFNTPVFHSGASKPSLHNLNINEFSAMRAKFDVMDARTLNDTNTHPIQAKQNQLHPQKQQHQTHIQQSSYYYLQNGNHSPPSNTLQQQPFDTTSWDSRSAVDADTPSYVYVNERESTAAGGASGSVPSIFVAGHIEATGNSSQIPRFPAHTPMTSAAPAYTDYDEEYRVDYNSNFNYNSKNTNTGGMNVNLNRPSLSNVGTSMNQPPPFDHGPPPSSTSFIASRGLSPSVSFNPNNISSDNNNMRNNFFSNGGNSGLNLSANQQSIGNESMMRNNNVSTNSNGSDISMQMAGNSNPAAAAMLMMMGYNPFMQNQQSMHMNNSDNINNNNNNNNNSNMMMNAFNGGFNNMNMGSNMNGMPFFNPFLFGMPTMFNHMPQLFNQQQQQLQQSSRSNIDQMNKSDGVIPVTSSTQNNSSSEKQPEKTEASSVEIISSEKQIVTISVEKPAINGINSAPQMAPQRASAGSPPRPPTVVVTDDNNPQIASKSAAPTKKLLPMKKLGSPSSPAKKDSDLIAKEAEKSKEEQIQKEKEETEKKQSQSVPHPPEARPPPPASKALGAPPSKKSGAGPRKKTAETEPKAPLVQGPLGRKVHGVINVVAHGTIFGDLNTGQDESLAGHHLLAEMFTKKKEDVDKQKEKEKKIEKIALLDPKLSLRVGILLQRLSIPLQSVKDFLLRIDASGMDPEDLTKVSSLLSPPEVKEALQPYLSASEDVLSTIRDEERGLIFLLGIPRVEARIKVLTAKVVSQSIAADAWKVVHTFDAARSEVRNSVCLRDLMFQSMIWTNYINSGAKTMNGGVAIAIDSVLALAEFRATTDTTVHALHYVACVLLRENPSIAENLRKETATLAAATRCSGESAENNLRQLAIGCRQVEQEVNQTSLYNEKELNTLKSISGELSSQYKELELRFNTVCANVRETACYMAFADAVRSKSKVGDFKFEDFFHLVFRVVEAFLASVGDVQRLPKKFAPIMNAIANEQQQADQKTVVKRKNSAHIAQTSDTENNNDNDDNFSKKTKAAVYDSGTVLPISPGREGDGDLGSLSSFSEASFTSSHSFQRSNAALNRFKPPPPRGSKIQRSMSNSSIHNNNNSEGVIHTAPQLNEPPKTPIPSAKSLSGGLKKMSMKKLGIPSVSAPQIQSTNTNLTDSFPVQSINAGLCTSTYDEAVNLNPPNENLTIFISCNQNSESPTDSALVPPLTPPKSILHEEIPTNQQSSLNNVSIPQTSTAIMGGLKKIPMKSLKMSSLSAPPPPNVQELLIKNTNDTTATGLKKIPLKKLGNSASPNIETLYCPPPPSNPTPSLMHNGEIKGEINTQMSSETPSTGGLRKIPMKRLGM